MADYVSSDKPTIQEAWYKDLSVSFEGISWKQILMFLRSGPSLEVIYSFLYADAELLHTEGRKPAKEKWYKGD
jgi:hypothetical protein